MIKKTLAAAFITAAALAPAAHSEEVYITGFGHIFSLGICGIGPGRCVSYLGIEGTIEDICRTRPNTPIRVAGHSMGASAAIRFVNGVHACGLKVDAAAFLDPQTHPSAFGLPKGVRTMTLYTANHTGIGEKKKAFASPANENVMAAFDPAARLGRYDDAQRDGASHIGQAFDGSVHARVRALFDGARSPSK